MPPRSQTPQRGPTSRTNSPITPSRRHALPAKPNSGTTTPTQLRVAAQDPRSPNSGMSDLSLSSPIMLNNQTLPSAPGTPSRQTFHARQASMIPTEIVVVSQASLQTLTCLNKSSSAAASPARSFKVTEAQAYKAPTRAVRPRVINFGPAEDSASGTALPRITKPLSSPFEIRCYGLSNSSDVVDQLKELMATIPAEVYDLDDPANLHLFRDLFISIGEPSLNQSVSQTSVNIRATTQAFQNRKVNDVAMAKVLHALASLSDQHEIEFHWSCAKNMDRRNQGVFHFQPINPADKSLTQSDAQEFITAKTAQYDMTINGFTGSDFMYQRGRANTPTITRTAKFLYPSDVLSLVEMTKDEEWIHNGHRVTFKVPTNFIPVAYPTTIAVTGASAVDIDTLMAELWTFADLFNERFNRDDGFFEDARMWHGRIFSVSCSSIHLALYICEQVTELGKYYELLYILNDHNLMPKEVREANQARNNEASRQRQGDQLTGLVTEINGMKDIQRQLVLEQRRDKTILVRIVKDNQVNYQNSQTYFHTMSSVQQRQSDTRFELITAERDLKDARMQLTLAQEKLIVNKDNFELVAHLQHVINETNKDISAQHENIRRLRNDLQLISDERCNIPRLEFVDTVTPHLEKSLKNPADPLPLGDRQSNKRRRQITSISSPQAGPSTSQQVGASNSQQTVTVDGDVEMC